MNMSTEGAVLLFSGSLLDDIGFNFIHKCIHAIERRGELRGKFEKQSYRAAPRTSAVQLILGGIRRNGAVCVFQD